jgi:hypothetical protein
MISEKLESELTKLNQRKLTKGELFLFSFAIASYLELPPKDIDSIKQYTISKKIDINNVIYELNDYSYLTDEDIDEIYLNITNILTWRHTVAYVPTIPLFTDENEVIDDLSLITRYVDQGTLCSLKDISSTINHMTSLFFSLTEQVFSE